MRSADAVTVLRTAAIIVIAYLVLLKVNAFLLILHFAIAIVADALDGFFAVREVSKGKVQFIEYVKGALGNAKIRKRMSEYKHNVSKIAPSGARIDVAGDRVTEYVMWILFTFLHILPLFVIFIIVIRHSFADALLAAKGTSSRMKSKFAKAVYASNISRFGINTLKFITFSYLMLVYIYSYPLWVGYVLVAALVIYIVIRGIAEVYEATFSAKKFAKA